MINYSDYYSEYFFDCFQNSDLTKETLKMYPTFPHQYITRLCFLVPGHP